ncbi:MAG: serine hydrolase [Bacteroidota bacterium]
MLYKSCCILLVMLGFVNCSDDASMTSTDTNNEINETPSPPLTPLDTISYFPPIASGEWASVALTQLGWNSDAEQPLHDFLEESATKAFILLYDGRMVIEWYFDDHTQNTNWYWASAAKTLTAFTMGVAQAEGLLDIEEATTLYLGQGWTTATAAEENEITIRNQLTMTTGLNNIHFDCTDPECLTYVADPGTRWAYHNAPYTLLQEVVAQASGMEWSTYFKQNVRDRLGMDGFWLSTNTYNNVYFSTARSMARFGLLNLNQGIWQDTPILTDRTYQAEMINTSQDLNQSYGYLWWLNGKSSYHLPDTQLEISGSLIPNAPTDTFMGLGRDDQKLYVVPSQKLVVVRMGEAAGTDTLGPSSYDNILWERLNALIN